ncbi:hypothetical protein VRU48_06920 [Pedobacter sp. KR3-3]|uniref:Uncharacterized protein n=1 Tax=Pedobacter albus TaxID=3113905 RepID=A0ABU7I5T3_9SPHI|nr:hypothetical protein [Pedobacter sp. KR3-3]MEE1944830.1 hypothetical protein [Pedobacter sp. KR3-3]
MLNLKELEKSLDQALERETTESVLAWFKEREKKKVADYIGVQGYLRNMEAIRDTNSVSNSPSNSQTDLNIPKDSHFAIAA